MTYKTFEVFPKEFLFLDGFNLKVNHEKFLLGQDYQKQEIVYNKSDRMSFDVTLPFNNYDEYYKIRQWFKNLKGKFGKFWFPSITNELKVIPPVSKGDYVIQVINDGITYFNNFKSIFLYFREQNFITYVAKVKNLGYKPEYKNEVLELTLEDNLPFNITEKSCFFVNFLYLGGLGDDSITFDFINLVKGEVKFNFLEITQAHYKKLNLIS